MTERVAGIDHDSLSCVLIKHNAHLAIEITAQGRSRSWTTQLNNHGL